MPATTQAVPIKGRILVVDDEPDIRESLELLLTHEGYAVEAAQNAAEGMHRMESTSYDLVLLDLMLPDRSGLDVLRDVRERDQETPIFMLTAYGSVEAAVSALKLGANDFIPKVGDSEKLLIEIEREIARKRLEHENINLKRALRHFAFRDIVGQSEPIRRALRLVEQVAPSRSTVLITGETGTGKELIARAIHALSPRTEHPFVAVNSGSLPPELLESTLFGHVKGAFTSAISSKKGYFEVADKGTIFFDEIGTIGLETQIKLLRVVQEREFIPLGATESIRVDVRIMAATNADLLQLVKEGRFREDLYYRLNVINIQLPALRDRKEDIPSLVSFFFDRYCRDNNKFLDAAGNSVLHFTSEAMQVLMAHNWPGNIRELENVVERAVVLASEPTVPVDVFPDHLLQASGIRVRRGEGDALPADASLFDIVNEFERSIILQNLEECSWSQTEAAEKLHVPLSTLNQKIKRLDIKIRKKSEA